MEHPNDGSLRAPALIALTWGLGYWLPVIDPRRANYARFRGTYDIVVAAILALLLVVHGCVLAAGLGVAVPIPTVVPLAVGALLIIIGNLLPRARPNWFFGIRTPWTLSNDRVWSRTHRLGGRLMVVAGIVVALSAFVTAPWSAILIPVSAVGAGIIPVVYSYVAWREEQRG